MLGAGAPQPAYDRGAPQLAVKTQQPEAASAEEQETSREEIAGDAKHQATSASLAVNAKRRTPSQGEDEDEDEDEDDEDEDGEILLGPDPDVFEFHVGYHGEHCPETATFQVADERLPRCLECGKFIKTARGYAPAAGKKQQQTTEASQLAEAAPAPPAAAPQESQVRGTVAGHGLLYVRHACAEGTENQGPGRWPAAPLRPF